MTPKQAHRANAVRARTVTVALARAKATEERAARLYKALADLVQVIDDAWKYCNGDGSIEVLNSDLEKARSALKENHA